MGMNKSKGNMYEWIDDTWNPLGGKCLHGCSYCSTNKFHWPNVIKKYAGPPRLFEHELKNLGSGKTIFVCAQNDLFADGIDPKIVTKILAHCSKFDNTYLFQTKNPKFFEGYGAHMPEKIIFCTTIETNRWYPEVMNNCPKNSERSMGMESLSDFVDMYVTIEPIMDFDLDEMVQLIKKCNPKQVNIGADSGGNNLPEPDSNKIFRLIKELEKFTFVKRKSNLKRLL